ncbi:orf21 protein [Ophiostoma piceae UAMH 11346]|uniref:Orf21 protein n=1 Tax=Ophiostoma piceae (strain UAMH 11346) TaxID=1262450 RepID=S3CV87_OPHP1|nr:orf21 protein [Ophiostoma piceae UAMH 11346]
MAMLKRKRSDSELSLSSSSTLSPPSRPPTTFNFSNAALADVELYASAKFRGLRAPSHLNSRTMKRTRNGRPPEAEVYERTLGLLYAAQESAHHRPAQTEEPPSHYKGQQDRDGETQLPPRTPQSTDDYSPPNQPSLYSFWNIASPAPCKLQPPAALAAPSYAETAPPSDDDHCMAYDM